MRSSISDPIADLLTRIRNAKRAKHKYVDFILSKQKLSIIKILQEQGFIENFLVDNERRKARVFLKYAPGRESIIQQLKRISSPGIRRYVGYKKIPRVLGGMGVAVLSTPRGIIDGETARKWKVGGELLFCVW